MSLNVFCIFLEGWQDGAKNYILTENATTSIEEYATAVPAISGPSFKTFVLRIHEGQKIILNAGGFGVPAETFASETYAPISHPDP